MQSKLSNKLKAYTKLIAYNIIGGYARGAAYESVTLSGNLSNKDLGKKICTYNRPVGEHFNPLGLNNNTDDRYVNMTNVKYLNSLISYAKENIEDAFYMLDNQTALSESEKLDKLNDVAKKLSREIGKVAFSEGMIDEELKSDIALILKEGKEKFEQRAQEALAQEPAKVSEMPAPEGIEPQQDQQDPFAQDMQGGEDPFAMDDQNNDFGFNDENNTQDLGFEDGFGDFGQDSGNAMSGQNANDIANKMDQFSDDTAAESKLIDMLDKEAFSESYNYNGTMTTLHRKDISSMVDELLTFEDQMFSAVAESAGVDYINSEEYSANSKYAINELAVILTTRKRLNI